MTLVPLAVIETGMVTAVGLNTAASCAAIRSAIDNFQETRFSDKEGELLIGSEVILGEAIPAGDKLLEMAALSIKECVDKANLETLDHVPLILCLPESNRTDRLIKDDDSFFEELQSRLDVRFSKFSRILVHGHTAVAVAVKHARQLLTEKPVSSVLITGVDSLLTESTLTELEHSDRLLTSTHSNGLIPGEGSATLLITRSTTAKKPAMLLGGLGFSIERATIGSGKPLRADGLTNAIKSALLESALDMHDMDYRITDMTGEHYHFKEASLAMSRTLRERTENFDILHPSDCVGEAGAATGPIMLAYQHYLFQAQASASSNVLAHFSDTDGKRAAIVLSG